LQNASPVVAVAARASQHRVRALRSSAIAPAFGPPFFGVEVVLSSQVSSCPTGRGADADATAVVPRRAAPGVLVGVRASIG